MADESIGGLLEVLAKPTAERRHNPRLPQELWPARGHSGLRVTLAASDREVEGELSLCRGVIEDAHLQVETRQEQAGFGERYLLVNGCQTIDRNEDGDKARPASGRHGAMPGPGAALPGRRRGHLLPTAPAELLGVQARLRRPSPVSSRSRHSRRKTAARRLSPSAGGAVIIGCAWLLPWPTADAPGPKTLTVVNRSSTRELERQPRRVADS